MKRQPSIVTNVCCYERCEMYAREIVANKRESSWRVVLLLSILQSMTGPLKNAFFWFSINVAKIHKWTQNRWMQYNLTSRAVAVGSLFQSESTLYWRGSTKACTVLESRMEGERSLLEIDVSCIIFLFLKIVKLVSLNNCKILHTNWICDVWRDTLLIEEFLLLRFLIKIVKVLF